MKIEISEGQFRRLLRLVYLGNWLVNGYRTGKPGDGRAREYDEIEKFFAKLARENGHIGTFEADEEAQSFIDDYNDDTFWDELGIRLAERDILEEIGEDEFFRLKEEERLKIRTDKESVYFGELEENGIENLRLVQTVLPEDLCH